jgi:biopolymer transport protein ExbB/TolQ
MNLWRVLPLGAAVTALLLLVAIASHGRPLSGSGHPGPTASFFDYVYTTVVIVALVMTLITVYAFAGMRGRRWEQRDRRWHMISTLLMLAAAALFAYYLQRSHFLATLHRLEQNGQKPGQQTAGGKSIPPGSHARGARLRWDEIVLIALLLVGMLVVALMNRSRRALRPLRRPRTKRDELARALDESLDDLRSDPDLRRAIIAAYARMERALEAAALPRWPAEAPFEYVERVLESLDASAASVRRLTVLFEWAKFSQHEPEPAMRDEAIDALVAVRDELRSPIEAAA